MPTHSRTIDYLKSHDSLGRRVRNLETGVHPTTADTTYWDDTNWQLARTPEPAWRHACRGSRGHAAHVAPSPWHRAPARRRARRSARHLRRDRRGRGAHRHAARRGPPAQDTRLLATIQGQSPYVAPAEIRTDGHLILFRGDITGDYTGSILLNGQTWTTQ